MPGNSFVDRVRPGERRGETYRLLPRRALTQVQVEGRIGGRENILVMYTYLTLLLLLSVMIIGLQGRRTRLELVSCTSCYKEG